MPRNHRIKGENKVAEKSIYLDLATHESLKAEAQRCKKRMSHLAIEIINDGLDGKTKKRYLRPKKARQVLGVKETKLMQEIAILLKCPQVELLPVLEAAKMWIEAFGNEL